MPQRADTIDTIDTMEMPHESGRCPLMPRPHVDAWRSPWAFEPPPLLMVPPSRQTRLEREILTGFERNEFELFYQPIVHALDDQRGGYEALMRWHHPSRGWLTPDSFLDIAVGLGLASELGDWTLRQAAHAVSELAAAGADPTVAVNLFSEQLDDGKLLQSMQRAADAASVPISALAVEISETTLSCDVPVRRATVDALRSVGVSVAVDDFGVGYTNLMRLRELDVDFLKIDQSIISNVDTDPVSKKLLKIVLDLASVLGVEAIAEGIETAAQAAVLSEVDCVWAQGYYVGMPMPLEHVVATTRTQLAS